MISIEYGNQTIEVTTAASIDSRGMGQSPKPLDPHTAIPVALQSPIASHALLEIAQEKLAITPNSEAVIVVSDNTRPVPYRGQEGIMYYIIQTLIDAGYPESQIIVLIGAGSHRNMEEQEIEEMLGLKATGFPNVKVENHEYDNEEHLTFLGHTQRGSLVKINKRYMQAGLKIVTGLVESHFMAGASGGRKGICPGIVGKETLTIFHGAKMLNSKMAADLVLEGNPLSDESLEVAQMAGCDFLVNTTIDSQKKLTGVFAGNLVEAHQAAVRKIREYVVVPLAKRYDIVIIPAGFVGVNHYQAAKAAVEAARALKEGGQIILIAKHTDPDPIGGEGYKTALRLLHEKGKEQFLAVISADDWQMIQEQWQVQMWAKVFTLMGTDKNLIYCNLDIPSTEYKWLPGTPGMSLIANEGVSTLDEAEKMKLMVESAINQAVKSSDIKNPSVLFLQDGPYGIPEIQ